jgi:hypothetical protein
MTRTYDDRYELIAPLSRPGKCHAYSEALPQFPKPEPEDMLGRTMAVGFQHCYILYRATWGKKAKEDVEQWNWNFLYMMTHDEYAEQLLKDTITS